MLSVASRMPWSWIELTLLGDASHAPPLPAQLDGIVRVHFVADDGLTCSDEAGALSVISELTTGIRWQRPPCQWRRGHQPGWPQGALGPRAVDGRLDSVGRRNSVDPAAECWR